MSASTTASGTRGQNRLVVYLLIGAVVSLSLGVYGRVHDPTGEALISLVFSSSINLKVWLATTAFGLAIFQDLSAAKMYGKLGSGYGPRWLGKAHRTTGTLAFLCAVPVAYHCLYSLGFQSDEPRVLVHGLSGCLFFGALTAKVLVVRARRMPKLALPVLGGIVFTALTGIWLTSSLWFFTTVDFPGF